MQFGKITDPESADLSLPADYPLNLKGLPALDTLPEAYVGLPRWGRKDLPGFYPKAAKDDLIYYSQQYNSVEFNSTFYTFPAPQQVENWCSRTPAHFRFFPKVHKSLSHRRIFRPGRQEVKTYVDSILPFGDQLGVPFMQMPETMDPTQFDNVERFLQLWPSEIPLSLEFRHGQWYNEPFKSRLFDLMQYYGIIPVITDTAGRRDLVHMMLPVPQVVIRFVGAGIAADDLRIRDWVERLSAWRGKGLQHFSFFVHQNFLAEYPRLSHGFIEQYNTLTGDELLLPRIKGDEKGQTALGF